MTKCDMIENEARKVAIVKEIDKATQGVVQSQSAEHNVEIASQT